ncbi:hypothetical protein [Streptomyces vastus]|uniref:hypothetical protein n=1 Tax=Streptomyces vastus TaxID=285451 RepID=UPI003CD0AF31
MPVGDCQYGPVDGLAQPSGGHEDGWCGGIGGPWCEQKGMPRAIAREHLYIYLNSPYNIAKFRWLCYSEEEIAGGSDRIVDDLVFWGDLETIVEKLHVHVEAGADHVAVQVIVIEPGESAMPYWPMLGEALPLPGGTT